MTLIDFLDAGCEINPSGPCLIDGETALSYSETVAWSHRIAWTLQGHGAVPGVRVGILAHNSPWAYVALLGLQRARCVWVPLNARSSMEENIRHLVRCGTEWLFIQAEFSQQLHGLLPELTGLRGVVCLDTGSAGLTTLPEWVSEGETLPFPSPTDDPSDDDFRITSSGGTTGTPKAVVQTQRGVETGVATYLAAMRYDTPPKYLLCNPMTHVAGIASFHVLALGGEIHFLRRPDPASVVDAIESKGIETLILTPTTLYALLALPGLADRNLSSLRYLMTGAAPVSAAKLQEAIDVLGPVVMQGFGQTEASPALTLMMPNEYAHCLSDPLLHHRLRSCGRATTFTRAAIMDEAGELLPPGQAGELVVRSSLVMRGYWVDGAIEKGSRRNGWHATGDVAYRDEDGYLYIVGRLRDLIITGGFNVFPAEVEQVIWSLPSVQDCAVVGVPDDKWGEAVKAIVSLKPGASLTESEVIAACRERVGSVKTPKSVEFWDDLPKSAVGKVLKREISGLLAKRRSEEMETE